MQRCLSTRALLAENKALRAHLKLFETCQRIAATLDRERLVPLALSAVAERLRRRRRRCCSSGPPEGWCVLSGAHGLDYEAGAEPARSSRARAWDAGRAPARRPSPAPASWPRLPATRRPAACRWPTTAGVVGAAIARPGRRRASTAERAESARPSSAATSALALRNLGRLKQVEHLAYLDDLTHLYNTRYLDLVLDRELAGGRPFTRPLPGPRPLQGA